MFHLRLPETLYSVTTTCALTSRAWQFQMRTSDDWYVTTSPPSSILVFPDEVERIDLELTHFLPTAKMHNISNSGPFGNTRIQYHYGIEYIANFINYVDSKE